jgi:spermidine/putrescine transport system substrate-binding protein
MNDPLRPDVDLERELIRYMAEHRITRRMLLEQIAKVGAFAALAPIIVACSSSAASAAPSVAPSPSTAVVPPSVAPTATAAPTATPAPTPVPVPESELHIWNYAEYMGEDVIPSFEEKILKDYKVKIKVSSDFFDTYEGMYARVTAGQTGFDITFPTSTDIPGLVTINKILPLDLSLIPNKVNLAPEWSNPGYDPGNAHSMPYMWWTTGVAYDSDKIKETPTSWKALWDDRWSGHIAMLDDQREAFAAALIQLGFDANTVDDGQLDQALALLKQQHPLVRLYSVEDQQYMASGDIWIGHAWGSDIYVVQAKKPSVQFYIPEEGSVRGSDTAVILDGAKNPIAANLVINHLLDAHVSASNSNFIGYMGPNAAAKQYITKDLLDTAWINPDKAVVDKLQELLDLGLDTDKYATRWTELKSGI